ncbi:MAG: hypothetical protein L0216_11265 [Planctomycetales bacterium]|nr:hypothetical protein [Planctomycetales bacterium]
MRGALEALPGVLPPAEVQYVSSLAWVRFDPAKVGTPALLDALRLVGYEPALAGPVEGVGRVPGLTVRAAAKPWAIAPGGSGVLWVRVLPDPGITVRGPDGGAPSIVLEGAEGAEPGPLSAPPPAEISAAWRGEAPLRVPAGDPAGDRRVTVRLRLALTGAASPPDPWEIRVPIP